MSSMAERPVWWTLAITLVLTAAVTLLAYFAWTYANLGVRQLPRGSGVFALLKDLRFFVGLLAVFVALTVLDRGLDRVLRFAMVRIGK